MEPSVASVSKRHRPPSFKVEIPGDGTFKQLFLDKMQKVRTVFVGKLQRPVSNAGIIGVALDTWLEDGGGDKAQSQQARSPASPLQEKDTDQEVYMVAVSSLKKLDCPCAAACQPL